MDNRKLNKQIKNSVNRLTKEIKALDVTGIEASGYVTNYLKSYQSQIDQVVQRYAYLLSLIIDKYGYDISLVDYGGGTGLLSILAKKIGIKKVTYIDISPEMKKGAQSFAKSLNIDMDNFFVWSYEDGNPPVSDADVIVNYDVLEHLYNPLTAFKNLSMILNENGTILMASGANTFHPVIRWLFTKKHKISEYIGTQSGKEIDTKESFYEVRKKIIRENFPQLSEQRTENLAKLTRGYRENDIISKVGDYLSKEIKIKPARYFNTCDPKTGNWDEHLIQYFDFKDRLSDYFESVNLTNGWYPTGGSKFHKAPDIKDDNLIKKLYPYLSYIMVNCGFVLNFCLRFLPATLRLFLAPYYIVEAKSFIRKEKQSSTVAKIYDEWNAWSEKAPKLNINLHYIPNQSAKYVQDFLEQNIGKDSLILDAGCGNGTITSHFINKGYQIEGCDISRQAEKIIPVFYHTSIEAIPVPDQSYDLIYSLSVLHHLKNPEEGINELKRVLKDKGYLIITNHTKYSVFTFIRRYILSRFTKYKHLKYLKFNSSECWISRLEDNGFSLVVRDGIRVSFILDKLADLTEKLLPGRFNFFAFLDNNFKKLIPKKLLSEIAYHSCLTFRKNEE